MTETRPKSGKRPNKGAGSSSVRTRRVAAGAYFAIISEKEALEMALEAQEDFAGLESRDRAFARLIVATTCRRQGQIIAALKPFLRKAPPDNVVAFLHTAAAQGLFLKTPSHAVVSETVQALKSEYDTRGYASMANAVLRRVMEKGPALAAALAPRQNIPGWIRGAWERAYGRTELRKISAQLMKDPPLDISVKSDVEGWAEKLGGTVIGRQTVRLPEIGHVTELAGFETGEWWVQDIAASLPAQVLQCAVGDLSGKNVLDLCAAPGGKTLQLAAMGANVTSIDKSESRMARVHENLSRTKLAANVVCADALAWEPEQKFDAILLDAPCSATGTFRRHPDVLINRTPKDVSKLVKLQARLMRRAADWLTPGRRTGLCGLFSAT